MKWQINGDDILIAIFDTEETENTSIKTQATDGTVRTFSALADAEHGVLTKQVIKTEKPKVKSMGKIHTEKSESPNQKS